MVGEPDGSIVSLGEDRRVRRTLNGTTTTLTADVSYVVVFAYAPSRRILGYATSRGGIALLNLRNNVIERLTTNTPIAMSFASDGTLLAALDKFGALTIWDITSKPKQKYRTTARPGERIEFIANDRIVVLGDSLMRSVHLPDFDTTSSPISATAIHSNGKVIAIGSSQGEVVLLSPDLVVRARQQVCKGRVTTVQFVPGNALLAYGCYEGNVGILHHNPNSGELSKRSEFYTKARLLSLTTDTAGQYLFACSEREAYLHNLHTDITTALNGQAARIVAIAGANDSFSHFLTGDIDGTVRIWDAEESHAHVIARLQGRVFGLEFVPDNTAVAVYGEASSIRIVRLAGGTPIELQGHTSAIRGVKYYPALSSSSR